MSSKFLLLVKTCLLFIITSLVSISGFAQVSGKVFKDMNSNGVQNLPIEIGLANYKVHAFLPNNPSPKVTLTNSDGQFNFSATEIPSGTNVRIEFPDLHNQYIGLLGTESKSNVQFVTAGTGSVASIGILNSTDFCSLGGLEILTACYVNGDPLVPGGSTGQDVAIVKFPYDASGLAGSGSSPYPDMLAKATDVGAIWGTTYQRRGKVFLLSAIVRRHSGLGSLGTGGIYKYDVVTNTTSQFIDVKTLGINTGNDPHTTLTGDKLTPNTDPNTIPVTGKVGIGAMTLSDNEKDLLFVNLYDRKIYSMEVGVPATSVNPSSIKSFAIPNGCGSGDFRPWALSEYQGKIYVGTVCSGETNQNFNDLKAIVYSLNTNTGIFTEVLQIPLTYTKGISDATGTCPQYNKWNPWTDTFPQGCARFYDPGRGKQVNFVMYPQPILSGISFDADGSMILGFMDRFGLWAGYRNMAPVDDGTLYDGFVGGDLLRAHYNALTNSYTLESNGVSGDLTGCGVNNGEGPGGGEFFCNDTWYYYGKPAHNEITNGGVLVLPSTGTVISSTMDPVNEIYQSGGIRTFDRKTGALKYGYALYSDEPGSLGKSGGTGDFKATCDPAPIEIGNRVWKDLNLNGIQDPEEPGIANITINIYEGSTLVGTTQTNSIGEYFFNSSNVTGGLKYETDYKIVLAFGQTNITNLGNPMLTTSNVGSASNSEFLDSDGIMVGTNAEILIKTGAAGITNYSFDFGITTCSPYSAIIKITKPDCIIRVGKIEITSPVGPNYLYSIDGFNFTSNKTVFDSLSGGTYKVVVKNENDCVSDTIKVIIENAPPKPAKPSLSVLQPSCQINTGMISVVSPTGNGYSYSLNGINFNNTSGVFNGLASGIYNIYVKNTDNCISDTAKATILLAPSIPLKPISTVIQPDCAIKTGTITITSPAGVGFNYSIDGVNFTNTTGVFANLTPGSYTVWAKNAFGCISDTTNKKINIAPTVPIKPVVLSIPLACKDLTGSISVSSPLGSEYTYSINGVTFTNTSGVFNNLMPDTYLIWVKNQDGCISPSTSITINPAPSAPSKPVVTVSQPSCTVSTGTITVTSPTGAGLVYSIDGINFTNTTGIFPGKTPGNYMVWAKNASGCKDSTVAILNAVPNSPLKPTFIITQPTCIETTGTITVTSPTGNGIVYSIDGIDYSNTNGVFASKAPGNYTIWVKNSNGCISSNEALVPAPLAGPAKPVLEVTQPTCTIATGSITVTSPIGTGVTYSIDGVNFTNTNGIFSSLSAGNYSVWAKNSIGCISLFTSSTINAQPVLPNAGPDVVIYAPVNVATLNSSQVGGIWNKSSENLFNSNISSTGVVSGLNNIGDYFYVYSFGTCKDTVKVTVLCVKPTLTVGNIKCNGSTYSVDFYSSSNNIITNAGNISGSQIINIPIGTNLSVKAIIGTGCETVLDVISPQPCDPTCVFSNLSVGQPICKGTTYSVSYKVDFGTVTSNAGTVYGDSIVNIPIGTYLIVTATNNVGSAICKVNIAVPSPASCLDECTNPGVSVSGPQCTSANTYSVNYSLISGVTITSNFGTISNSKITNIPADKSLIITVKKIGCADKIITVLPPTTCVQPCNVKAGNDQIVYMPTSTTNLVGSPIGGTWSVSSSNINSSTISATGLVSNLLNAGVYDYIYKVGQCADTVKVTVLCVKPTLTVGNIKCNGSTYSVDFYSSSNDIITNAGNISGSQIINIPIGTNLSVKAIIGTGCETVLDVISPQPCDPTCVFSNLSVGQPICKGTTYSVSYKVDFGTVTSNAGTVYGDSIVNIPIGTYLIVTATNNVGSAMCKVNIAVPSPASCLDECTNPGVSVSGPICSGNGTYSVNYIKIAGVNISVYNGTVLGNQIVNIPISENLVLTVSKPGCAPKQITTTKPTNCVTPCTPMCVPISIRKIR